jgi:hypothetical protein
MPVPAVRAEDDVALPEVGAHADGDRLFADVGVAGPVHEPALVRPGKLLFALTDDLHVVEEIEQRLFADGR